MLQQQQQQNNFEKSVKQFIASVQSQSSTVIGVCKYYFKLHDIRQELIGDPCCYQQYIICNTMTVEVNETGR